MDNLDIMNSFYNHVHASTKVDFMELYAYLCELGYKPYRAKTKDINIVFKNSKTREHIAKFSIENREPVLKMKFYSIKHYSKVFSEAIRNTIEEYNYRYTGCYACGKCSDQLEGYDYTYPDGRHYFRCGKELIPIYDFQTNDLKEIKHLLNAHHDYLLKREKLL